MNTILCIMLSTFVFFVSPVYSQDINLTPVANPGGPYSISEGSDLMLNAGASYDPNAPDDYIVSYSWDLDGDGIFEDDIVTSSPTVTISWAQLEALRLTRIGIIYTLSLRVADSHNLHHVASTTLSITPRMNRAPQINAIGNKNTQEGQSLLFTISATDPDGDTLTFSASNLPAGATFDPAARTFSWTPDYTQAGNYYVGFNVTDSGTPPLGTSESITITVGNVNRPPELGPIGNQTVEEGKLLQFTVTANDLDGDVLTYSVSNMPAGATFDPAARTFSWTPDYSQAGNHAGIEFTVTDNGSPSELDFEVISIAVGNVNRPPVFTSVGTQQTMENQRLEFTISAADPDGDTITYSTGDLPAGSSFDAGSGLFSWKPYYGQAGTYTVVFYATDNGQPAASAQQQVSIVVGPIPTMCEAVDTIIQAVLALRLQKSVENSYMANLKKVCQFVQQGKTTAASNQLDAFVNKVKKDISTSNIDQIAGNNLIDMTTPLINILKGQ